MSLDTAIQAQKQSAVMIGNESLLIECAQMWRDAGHEIALIVTRNAQIADWSRSQSIDVVLQEGALTDVTLPDQFDWLFSIANLQIIPQAHLSAAQHGAINFHDGPLPKYAGLNAPVWARLRGETQHGITWHLIEGEIDTGDILVQRHFDLTENDTALTLNTKCFAAAIESFPEVISAVSAKSLPGYAQDLTARSYFGRDDRPIGGGVLDFTQSQQDLIALVRALDHGAYFNPLCAAKVVIEDHILAVSRISARSETGTPGSVLSLDGDALLVACSDGSVLLSELTDIGDAQPAKLNSDWIGESASRLEDGEAIAQALGSIARHEPYWRTCLAEFMPARLPLLKPLAAKPNWKTLDIAGCEGLTETQALAAIAVFAERSGVATGTHFAYAHSGQTALSGHLSDWVPLAVPNSDTGSVDHYVSTVKAHLESVRSKDTFALDLPVRAPELERIATPDIAIVSHNDLAPINGTAVTFVCESGRIALHFDEARLSPEHASVLSARLQSVLNDMSAGAKDLVDIRALPAEERDLLLTGYQGEAFDIQPENLAPTAIKAQAKLTPDATALVFEKQSLTYSELDQRVQNLAQGLDANGVEAGMLVGVHCRRSFDLVVACLAIWRVGAAYLPLDPDFPADRLAIYLEDSAAPFVISQSAIAGALPETSAKVLKIDTDFDSSVGGNPGADIVGDDLAYLIFTSGSTGRPKGVMVQHDNMANFFAGMDQRVTTDGPATWMAVTSLSFDISVLELFYTLSRGHTVVISGDESATQISDGPIGSDGQGMDFSLYYWGNDDGVGRGKYRLLLEGAQFADENGFCAVWTPERHFHAFGGPYPNPSVTGAAVAGATKNIGVRAGSCVAPLHHTARIAEEWAVIDNLTGGKAGLAIASGWQPDDFVLRPENTPPANKDVMFEQIADLRKLWRGEPVEFLRADGTPHAVVTQPRPVSSEPDIWVTTAGNPETWKQAGRNGAHVLTHLLGQSVDEVAEKIGIYHAALREAGYQPDKFKVTLMLHTFVGTDREEVREIAREPMKDYLRSAAGLIKQYAWAFPAFKKPDGVKNPFELDLGGLSEDELEGILDFAFLRYFEDSGLFGTVDECLARTHALKKIGVTEIACLIDYGIDTDVVLQGLRPLAEVVKSCASGIGVREDDVSIAGQIIRHNVTHMQCTPSMARLLTMNDEAATALAQPRQLLVGGEALPGTLVQDLKSHTTASITNMYGPTETTIWSATAEAEEVEGIASIGGPIVNTRLYVLDDTLRPVPFGVAGELVIGGQGVARGYWRRDDLTAERFLPDPFLETGRVYRTGDLVVRRLDGSLDFVGRKDHQVKLRGYRMELGEIESCLETLPTVSQAVVIVREDTAGDPRLVAYVVGQALESEMRAALAARLPAYMLPSHYVQMSAFPLTPNKKIDRKALPKPKPKSAEPGQSLSKPDISRSVSADSGFQSQIAELWCEILGTQNISAKDNFFDLGGHSLLAVQAHRELRKRLSVSELSITDIFRFPILQGLAARISELSDADVPAQTTSRPVSDSQAQPSTLSRRDAMSKRRAMRARRKEKHL